MKPVTPLRRSDRLRRPSSKAIGSSPCSSPGTAVHHSPSVPPRSRVFSAPGGQPDSDSTLRNTNSSKSSGSCTEDTAGVATDSMVLVASFPPKLREAYQGLAPLLGHSNTELMKRDVPCLKVYLKQINAFLQKVIRIGFSCQWSEFNKFVELCDRIAKVIDAKGGTLSPKKQKKREETGFMGMGNGTELAMGTTWFAMKGEHWEEAWDDTADTEYLQRMYRNAAPPNNFGWDDGGASGSEVQSQETDALDYSLSYPRARTLDYCTIPDTY